MLTFIWALTSIWVPYKIDVGNFFANVIMLFSIFVNNCLVLTWIGLFQKKSKQRRGEMEYTFLNPPNGIFRFFTLPLEIPKSKTKIYGNSTRVFLEHPWNFNFSFNWLLEFPHALLQYPPKLLFLFIYLFILIFFFIFPRIQT